MVDRGLLIIARLIVNDAEVNVSEELASNIGHFFVSCVVIDRISVVLRVGLAQFHVVNTDAIVGKSLTVHVTNGLANLQELLVLLDSLLVLAQVVEKDTSRVVSAAFITRLASPAASKGEDVVVFEAFLRCNAIVGVSITHLQASVLSEHLCVQVCCLVLETFSIHDVFLALGCIKVDRQLDSLRLVHPQRQI